MSINNYRVMKEKHQEEINNFPMFFAFSKGQFEEGMRKFGLDPEDTDKIYKFGNTGGYYLRTDGKALYDMFDRQDEEMKKAMENDDFIYDMFYYELGNHEYIVTHEVYDTLRALGLTEDQVDNDERLSSALKRACKAQKQWYALNG